ncbi:MAG: translation initiation factor IF-1, partial [Rhodospirillales bacterium]
LLPNGMFRVKLEDGSEIIATVKGKLRRIRFRIMVGDRVNIEMTRYDTTKGRINYWHR